MTQLQAARAGQTTPEMERVAVRENLTADFVRTQVAAGRVVIPANVRHLVGSGGGEPGGAVSAPRPFPNAVGFPNAPAAGRLWVNQTVSQRQQWLDDPQYCRGDRAPRRLDPAGIGRALTTKVNANIGASPLASCADEELAKLCVAARYGADAVMDLSTGGDLNACRQRLIDHSTLPVGTVPLYSMIVARPIDELRPEHILAEIEHQAAQGVDFFTIHAGILRENLHLLSRRACKIVSRGGALLARWMTYHQRQNPMFELFDEISAIMRQYDVTYSLGDGMRPGSLRDASDPAQLAELHVLADLVQRSREAGVQAMVEGPGHIPLNEVAFHMETQRRVCDDAPFYVLGPIVSDVFPGYDHLTSAIGATEAARAGAAMLCYVTPREHLALPTLEDVKAGCIAYRIAAHAGDVARGIAGAGLWDDALSEARAAIDWPQQFTLAFDGETARGLREAGATDDRDHCSMCGREWCALRVGRDALASGGDQGIEGSRDQGTAAGGRDAHPAPRNAHPTL